MIIKASCNQNKMVVKRVKRWILERCLLRILSVCWDSTGQQSEMGWMELLLSFAYPRTCHLVLLHLLPYQHPLSIKRSWLTAGHLGTFSWTVTSWSFITLWDWSDYGYRQDYIWFSYHPSSVLLNGRKIPHWSRLIILFKGCN